MVYDRQQMQHTYERQEIIQYNKWKNELMVA
jgi:hypothetical protein